MIDVGSHVILIDNHWPESSEYIRASDNKLINHIRPVRGIVYTVRGIYKYYRSHGLLLEEIINPLGIFRGGNAEPMFYIYRFRPLKKLKVEDFLNVKEKEPA